MSAIREISPIQSSQLDFYRSAVPEPGITTETIDLVKLYSDGANSNGDSGLIGIETTPLGKLLHALPTPAMLMDNWYSVVFANQSCSKLGGGFRTEACSSFPDLFCLPDDPERARVLRDSALAMLGRAFSTRKAEIAEAILQVAHVRLWARLHLRPVKITTHRYVLVFIEDVTAEKAESKLSRLEELQLRRNRDTLGDMMHELRQELKETRERLRMVTALYTECRQQLQLYQQRA